MILETKFDSSFLPTQFFLKDYATLYELDRKVDKTDMSSIFFNSEQYIWLKLI